MGCLPEPHDGKARNHPHVKIARNRPYVKIAFNEPHDGKALEPDEENAYLYVEIAQKRERHEY
jgi:hypothetical protein